MKTNKRTFLILLGIATAFTISCDRQLDLLDFDQNMSALVQGTYTGQITNSISNVSRPATLTVSQRNDSLISMYCIASDFESTIMVSLYQDADNIRVCSTGSDFYNQYGHEMNGMDFSYNMQQGRMRGNMHCNSQAGTNQWSSAWTNHMNTQHNANDEHFGDFDTKTNSAKYAFQMKTGNATYVELFQGVKNQ